jgi:hypothetical protein
VSAVQNQPTTRTIEPNHRRTKPRRPRTRSMPPQHIQTNRPSSWADFALYKDQDEMEDHMKELFGASASKLTFLTLHRLLRDHPNHQGLW